MQASAFRITTLRIHKNVCHGIRLGGQAVAQLVEALATSQKVTGLIPDGVTGIFS
jgi:hypothetical protein